MIMANFRNLRKNGSGSTFLSRFFYFIYWNLIAIVPLGLSMLACKEYSSIQHPSISPVSNYFLTSAGLAGIATYFASFVVVLLLPGIFILEIFFPPGHLSWVEKIPLSFVASLGILLLPALYVRYFLLPLETFYWIFAAVYSCVAILWAIIRSKRGDVARLFPKRFRSINLYLLIGAILFILWFPWGQPIQNYDNWRYLAFIREDVDAPQILDTDPVFGDVGTRYVLRYRYNEWLLVTPLLSRSSGVDPVVATTGYLKLAMGIMSFFAVYVAARELFKDRNWALFTVLIQMLYFASDRSTFYSVGTLLNRIAEDKIIVGFFFLPMLYFFMARYWEGRDRWQIWALLTLSGLLMVDFNQIGIVLVAVPVLGSSFVHAFFSNRRKNWLLLIPIIVAIGLALPWPLFLKIATSQVTYTVTGESDSSQALSNLVMIFRANFYILHPNFVSHPLVISSIVLSLPLLFYLRKSLTAQLLLSNMLSSIVLLYVPFITPILGGFITPVMLWRVSWMMPVAFINSYWLYRFAQHLKKFLPDLIPLVWVNRLYLGQILPVLTLIPLVFMLNSRIQQFPNVKWIDGDVPHPIADFLTGARSKHVLEGKVISPPEMNLYIAGFWGRMYVMYDRSSIIPFVQLAMKDTKTFYEQSTLSKTGINILINHGVSHIIVPKDHALAPIFQSMISFTKLYEDDNYILFSIPKNLQSDLVFSGDVHFLHQEWQAAIDDYQKALDQNPNAPLNYLGIAQVYHGMGDMTNALTYYRRALERSQGNEELIDRIVQDLNIDTQHFIKYLQSGNNYQEGQISNWEKSNWNVYNFLDHLDSDAVSSSNPDYVKKSAYVMDGVPKGVIFQHPPTDLSFTLPVPSLAVLKFSIALDPKVWQLGYGDGVQFGISIDDGQTKSQIFSEYIDPKNMPSQRKWHNYVIDISRWSGQVVTMTFTTGCGPNNNCGYDWAAWGEPHIEQPISYDFITKLPEAQGFDVGGTLVRKDEMVISGEYRDILFEHPFSQAIYRLTVPEKAALYFGLGMDPSVWSSDKGDGVQYNLYVRKPEDPSRLYRVFHSYIDPKNKTADQHWFDCAVDLSKYSGQSVDLIFEATAGPDNDSRYDWGGWSMPVLVSNAIITSNDNSMCNNTTP